MFEQLKRLFIGIPLEERPEPECGDKQTHYAWINNGQACPECTIKHVVERAKQEKAEKERQKHQDMEELAELIATKLAAKLLDQMK